MNTHFMLKLRESICDKIFECMELRGQKILDREGIISAHVMSYHTQRSTPLLPLSYSETAGGNGAEDQMQPADRGRQPAINNGQRMTCAK